MVFCPHTIILFPVQTPVMKVSSIAMSRRIQNKSCAFAARILLVEPSIHSTSSNPMNSSGELRKDMVMKWNWKGSLMALATLLAVPAVTRADLCSGTLAERVDCLDEKLRYVEVETDAGGRPIVVIKGANVQIRRLDGEDFTGNLIIGTTHSWTDATEGFVAGTDNAIEGWGSSVSGGSDNWASGLNSSISGGAGNQAGADFSSISGGFDNRIIQSGSYASISGGQGNIIFAGDFASISGGLRNITQNSAPTSVVVGGIENQTRENYATILGGRENRANGYASTICGGLIVAEGNAYGVSCQ